MKPNDLPLAAREEQPTPPASLGQKLVREVIVLAIIFWAIVAALALRLWLRPPSF